MSWRSVLRRAVVSVAVCYGIAALATQAILARDFGHNSGFVKRLGELAYVPWVIALVLGGWLLALYFLHRRQGRVIVDTQLIDRSVALLPPLVLLAVAPFFSAYASHAILPALALLLAPVLWASLYLVPLDRIRPLLAQRWVPFAVAAAAAALYFVVSYYRHANFGSGSRDMGLFFQTVWLLSVGESPQNTVMGMHAFADHMEFIDYLMVPLVWIWRDAGALLLAQAVVTGAGAAAVMRITLRRTQDGVAALLFAGCYVLAYPIAQGVQFDWNPTTLSVGLLAWAFDLADSRRYRALIVVLVLVGLCKENLWLYVAAFGFYLVIDGHGARLGTAICAAAVLLFGVEMKVIFPIFRPDGFRHFYFKELGSSFTEVGLNVLASPLQAISHMVTPGNKVNGLLLPFASTAWLCLWAPAPLVVAVPALGERFLSSFRNSWWGHHYGGPTAAIVVVAAVYASVRLAVLIGPALRQRIPGASPTTLIALTCFCATLLVNFSGRWSPTDLFVLEKSYLPAPVERPTMRRAIASVPEQSSVAAQNYFLAHLAARKQIFELKEYRRCDVVVVNTTTNPWPYNKQYIERLVRDLERGPDYQLTFCDGNSWVFQRHTSGSPPSCPALERLLGAS